ncbi:MAG: hypothetical protein KH398_07070 [Veillonella sp.]|jgi:hypothetical protein|uniref:hypothetical protein n=1 Tax=Veillonella sp. TaxID=1926307 RepID=UPI001D315666|nr:hypothetical protein [Veillonella sp.]MBS6392535.1 hypothetical protein [Veillonella sp.]
MSTTFMLVNNPMDLVMNLIVDTADNDTYTSLDGAIEKYKVDFDATSKQAIFTFKMYGNSKFYKLRIIADADNELEELTSTERFFKIVNVLGLTINVAKSKKKSLGIKVDIKNSYVYLENLDSNDGTSHKFRGWLDY